MNAPPPPRADARRLTALLAAPFDPREVKFKPQLVKGSRAIAIAYVDARVIQDRLDEVLGIDGWQDEYTPLPDGSVVCRLRLKLGKRWITKMDVGSPSEQPDGGDRTKAAFSDALKRAAVKFGVGRYLYRLPAQWVGYDPVKKQFAQAPKLPAWAVPARGAKKAAAPAPAKPAAKLPVSGAELHRRLCDYDAELARKGVCRAGDLLAHVRRAGVRAGFPDDVAAWSGDQIGFAVEETRKFRDALPERECITADEAEHVLGLIGRCMPGVEPAEKWASDSFRAWAKGVVGRDLADGEAPESLTPAEYKALVKELERLARAREKKAPQPQPQGAA